MRRILLCLLLSAVLPCLAAAQVDSVKLAKMESMLEEYMAAIEQEPVASKAAECDFLIGTCTDPELRNAVATRLYARFVDPVTMGEEAIAVYLYDHWFASGEAKFSNDIDAMNAAMYVEFNRPTLLGAKAPGLTLYGTDNEPVTLPSSGRMSVLYFYDTDCAKCKLESILLTAYLESVTVPLDFFAVYCGGSEESWKEYREERFNILNPQVHAFNLWDPEVSSDFLRKYGVLQTPRMFLVDEDGIVIGRRLTSDALRQLIEAGQVLSSLQDRCPAGSLAPRMVLDGKMLKRGRSKDVGKDISRLKGSPAYVVFYADGCSRCAAQLEEVDRILEKNRRARVFLVNVDENLASPEAQGKEIFDTFDLTVLPYILKLDRKGIVLDRYVDLKNE